jgi:hypothetical protein
VKTRNYFLFSCLKIISQILGGLFLFYEGGRSVLKTACFEVNTSGCSSKDYSIDLYLKSNGKEVRLNKAGKN